MTDFMGDCLRESGLQIKEVEQQLCFRCGNGNCSRSRLKGMLWDQRMARQLELLKGPRLADPNDPYYELFRRVQAFHSMQPTDLSVTSSTNESSASPAAQQIIEHAVATMPVPEPEASQAVAVPSEDAEPTAVDYVTGPPAAAPQGLVTYNTPNPGRIMIGPVQPQGGPSSTREIRIQPGGTVKL